MGIRDFMKNTILRMDLLSSAPTLRVRKQPQYQTIIGGILSFMIMGTFGYMLYLQLDQMMNKLSITYSQGMSDDLSSESAIKDVQFALSIQGVDLSATPRKFMFTLSQLSIVYNQTLGKGVRTTTSINLAPCELSDWQSLGENFKSQFQIFNFSQMLCIQKGQSPQLIGYAGSATYKYLKLQINPCNKSEDSLCDNISNVNTYMTNYLSSNDYFKVRYYLVDSIVTPTNQQAVVKFLEKNIFMAFTQTTGTVGFINLAQCTLETDNSLLPIEEIEQSTSTFIQDFYTNTVSVSSRYVQLYLYKSTKTLKIQRTIGKLDEVLSYVGGLFSLIFTIIAFFIASYSEMKYQIYVAQSMLTNEKGERITQTDFGFMTYLSYSFYDWMDTLGIAPSCCNRLSNIHEMRQQACEQLDPVIIMKRLKYLQQSNRILLKQQKLMSLYLTKSMTIEESKKMRSILTFTDDNFEQIYQNDQENHQQQISEHAQNTDTKLAKQFQTLQDEIKPEENKLSQQQEQQLLKKLILNSLQQLQRQQSQANEKIKHRISKRARQKIIQLCKKKDYDFGSAKVDIYPLQDEQINEKKYNDSAFSLNSAKPENQIKLGLKQKERKKNVIKKSKI